MLSRPPGAIGGALSCVDGDAVGLDDVVLVGFADGETGLLVDYVDNRELFESNFAAAINQVMSDTSLANKLGKAGRIRAVADFGWDKVATTTIDLYRSLI